MERYCYDDCYVLANTFGHFNESMISELLKSNVKDIVPHQYTIWQISLLSPNWLYIGM